MTGMGGTLSPRERLRKIIFEADTRAGTAFDVALLWLIIGSVVTVMLETVEPIREAYGPWLLGAEWVFTVLFTVEYVLRLYCAVKPGAYARSFFGIVDLLAVLPTYLSVLLPGSQSLIVIRAFRLLRVFRVLKLSRYLGEYNVLLMAMRSSGYKIAVFLGSVLVIITITATIMYLIEGEEGGFTSIPRSMYWAVVTMTTVGYGDIAPRTPLGQLLAGIAMLVGYSIIAVPTGIVSAEIAQVARGPLNTRTCPACMSEGHDPDARFCKDCGRSLTGEVEE